MINLLQGQAPLRAEPVPDELPKEEMAMVADANII